ncbi:LPXTG cell wall anchor domain-containing protein [Micromonospora sp. NPDC050397]
MYGANRGHTIGGSLAATGAAINSWLLAGIGLVMLGAVLVLTTTLKRRS